MALPFVNPVSQCMPGFGSPSNDGSVTQTLSATGAATLVNQIKAVFAFARLDSIIARLVTRLRWQLGWG